MKKMQERIKQELREIVKFRIDTGEYPFPRNDFERAINRACRSYDGKKKQIVDFEIVYDESPDFRNMIDKELADND